MDQLGYMVDDEFRNAVAKATPLPLLDFLNKYLLPVSAGPAPTEHDFPPDLFADVNSAKSEHGMYTPLSTALHNLLRIMEGAEEPSLDFKVTKNLCQKLTAGLYSRDPDLCALHRERSNEEISWEDVDLPIEVKYLRSADPVPYAPSNLLEPASGFEVVHSLTRDKSMSQFGDYSRYTMIIPGRTRVFVLGIFGSFARVFLFDHDAVAFSEDFNYNVHPELLGEFLYRYSKSSRAARGWDPTVTFDLSEVERQKVDRAIEMWNNLRKTVRIEHKVDIEPVTGTPCRITVNKNGKDHVFLTLGGPIFASMGLFSRGTRIWFAFDSSGELAEDANNAVVIKDSWTQDGRTLEERFYEVLGEYGPDDGIAQYSFSSSFDDDGFHMTVNHEIIGVCPRRHCRNVINTVGRRLSRYKSTKELVQGVDSAVAGHQKAFDRGVLHRDISERNVLLPLVPKTPLSGGFIIDFDLSLLHDDLDRVHSDQWDFTGTVQFMAVARLRDRDCRHEMWHDLESFFWVLLYVVSRHASNSWVESADTRGMLLALFETSDLGTLASLRYGSLLADFGHFSVKDNTPLTTCIRELAKLFANAYPVPQLNVDGVLPTYDDVRNILSNALSADGWPDEDSPKEWIPPKVINCVIQPVSVQTLLQQWRGSGSGGDGSGKRKLGSQGDGSVRSRKKSKGGAV